MAKVLTWCAFLLRTWAQIEMCHPETGPWQLEVLVVLKVVLACFAAAYLTFPYISHLTPA
jgi:hypothetical protein